MDILVSVSMMVQALPNNMKNRALPYNMETTEQCCFRKLYFVRLEVWKFVAAGRVFDHGSLYISDATTSLNWIGLDWTQLDWTKITFACFVILGVAPIN